MRRSAQDYAFGRDGVAAFKAALAKTGATLAAEEYAPMNTTDFTAPAQRLFDALKDKPGRKIIWVIWAGASPMTKLQDMNPGRYGIELSTGGNILPAMAGYKTLPGMEGATYYYHDIPKNEVNTWLVTEHQKRFNAPPDFFTAGGFAAAMAAVTAVQKAKSTDTEKLIAAMEGMEFDTPKGKMVFRKEDHQALQSMYHFKIKADPAVAWGIPGAGARAQDRRHAGAGAEQAVRRGSVATRAVLFPSPRESGEGASARVEPGEGLACRNDPTRTQSAVPTALKRSLTRARRCRTSRRPSPRLRQGRWKSTARVAPRDLPRNPRPHHPLRRPRRRRLR